MTDISAAERNVLSYFTAPALYEDVGETWWDSPWTELCRTQAFEYWARASTIVPVYVVLEALPIASIQMTHSVAALIGIIEGVFGDAATQTARMLRVSRPMVYRYRDGFEPSSENLDRVRALATLASECSVRAFGALGTKLKVRQVEGRTLLDFLSDEDLDPALLRRILLRNVQATDREIRAKLAKRLAKTGDGEERGDVGREKAAQGRAVYLGDPENPGTLIQVAPDGTRTRGKMVKRKFVPDD